MTRILRRTTCTLAALLVAAFLTACHTAASSSGASGAGVTSHGYAGYQTPSGSFGVAVFTSAPRPHGNDGSIWYYGNHPHPANHALGPLCHVHGSHRHDYAPYRGHRYAFHDGHYFWVGDAKPYASRDRSHAYHGHHPHPHYFGGTCRIRGLHQHGYAPRTANYYRMKSGAYFYTGTYGSDYYAERNRYDSRGWRLNHRSHGYREHESAWQDVPAAPDVVVQPSPARPYTRPQTQRVTETSPYDALDAVDRMSARQFSAEELVERMRSRIRGSLRNVPANAAPDGAHE